MRRQNNGEADGDGNDEGSAYDHFRSRFSNSAFYAHLPGASTAMVPFTVALSSGARALYDATGGLVDFTCESSTLQDDRPDAFASHASSEENVCRQ